MKKTDLPKKFLEGSTPRNKGKFPRGTKTFNKWDGQEDHSVPPVGMSRTHHIANKLCDWGCVGTNFSALKRYLRSRVGHDWNGVYSEICAKADKRTFKGHHLREWLEFAVEIQTHMRDGKVVDKNGHDVTISFGRENFYVHPESGTLEASKVHKRKSWMEHVPKTVYEVEGQKFHLHDGIWYRVEMREVDQTNKRWANYSIHHMVTGDEFVEISPKEYNYTIERKLRAKYGYSPEGKLWHCVGKESANSKEIAKVKQLLEE